MQPSGKIDFQTIQDAQILTAMTLEQLSHWITQGEGQHLEFKKRVPAPERVAKEIIAFANTHGGYLLLGIEDNGTITGVKDAAEEEFSLKEALRYHADPPVSCKTQRISVSRKRDIIVVTVRESRKKPHCLIDRRSGRRTAYVRVNDMSLEASREAVQLMRTAANKQDILFEIREKEHMLLRYLDRFGRISVRQFARLAGISRSSASRTLVLLTRANMLQHHSGINEDYFTHGTQMLSDT